MPTPKYLFEAQYDGVWTDITADVAQFQQSRGKDKRSENIPASSLDLTLNNDDHTYSPSNPSSPLYPYHRTGVPLRAFMAYPHDALEDSGTGQLHGRAVENDSNFGTWSGNTSFKFDGGNRVQVDSGDAGLRRNIVVDFGEADVWAGVTVLRLASSTYGFNGGLVVRYVDASNYAIVYITHASNSVSFAQRIGGTDTVYTAYAFDDFDPDVSAGDEVRLMVHCTGVEMDIYCNNYFLGTVTLDETLRDATEFGIGSRQVEAGDKWHQFGGWKPIFEGRTVSVDPRPGTSKKYCYIKALDDLERQTVHRVYRNSPDPPATAGEIITSILDATGVNAYKRRIDSTDNLSTDSTQVRIMGRDGFTELKQVEGDDVGLVYVDGAGVYRYEDTDHRITAPHDTELATWVSERSGTPAQTDKYFVEPFDWEDGSDLVENEIYYQYERYGNFATEQFWRMPEADTASSFSGRPQFEAGLDTTGYTKPLTMLVAPQERVSFIKPPEPGTDITINGEEDGAGVDLLTVVDSEVGTVTWSHSTFELDDTGQDFTDVGTSVDGVSATIGLLAVYLYSDAGTAAWGWGAGDDPDGDGTRITIQTRPPGFPDAVPGVAAANPLFSAASITHYSVYHFGVYFTDDIDGSFRQLNFLGPDYFALGTTATASGAWLTDAKLRATTAVKGNPAFARAEDANSQNQNGRRRVQYTTLHVDRYSVAKEKATARLAQRSTARERLTVTLIAGSASNLQEMLYRDISDRIVIDYSDMGVTNAYYIDRVIYSAGLHSGGAGLRAEFDMTRVGVNDGWGSVEWGSFIWSP